MSFASLFGGGVQAQSPSGGFSSLFGSAPSPEDQKLKDLQSQQQVYKANSDYANSLQGIATNTLKSAGDTLYNTGASIVLPGASQEETHDPEFLKTAAESAPEATYNLGKQVVTHPIQSAMSAVGGAARGISDSVTGIITNLFVPKNQQAATSAQIKYTLDKYLGESNPNDPIQQGFGLGGQAAPYIVSGEALGAVGGSIGGRIAGGLGEDATGSIAGRAVNLGAAKTGATVGQVVGNATGFVGVGQAALPSDSTLEQRAQEATTDLVGLGLFAAGSKAFDVAKGHIYDGLKQQIQSGTSVPKMQTGPFSKLFSATDNSGVSPLSKAHADYTISQGYKPTDQTLQTTGNANAENAPTVGTNSPVTQIEGESEKGMSKLASRINAKAIEDSLTKGFDNLPQYNKVNKAEQAKFATDLLQNEPDKAMNIAMGKEPPPAHILPESVFLAVEAKARAEGDVGTLRDLATKSNMSSQATAMGQRISMLTERDGGSPVKAIQEVQEARTKAAEKKLGKPIDKARKDTIKDISSEVKKAASKRPTWDEFMDQLTCNI